MGWAGFPDFRFSDFSFRGFGMDSPLGTGNQIVACRKFFLSNLNEFA